MLPAALRLSIVGCWNTIARRLGRPRPCPPQVTRPREGVMRPKAVRSKVVLPDPFGPMRTVGAPPSSKRVM